MADDESDLPHPRRRQVGDPPQRWSTYSVRASDLARPTGSVTLEHRRLPADECASVDEDAHLDQATHVDEDTHDDGEDSAARIPSPPAERSPSDPPPVGRARRFAVSYGWRAYAVPFLVVVTFFALLSVVRGEDPDRSTTPIGQAIDIVTPATATRAPTTSAAPSAKVAAPPPATAEGEAVDPYAPAVPTGSYVQAGNQQLAVVPGTSKPLGTAGPVTRFAVEVEGGTDVDAQTFAVAVEQTLNDPRSWTAGGRMRFQRVDSGPIDLYVALVSPAHVESLCPGYETNGYTSCRYGNRAVINLARWSVGVPFYDGHLADYRHMVLNHEIGHWLGQTHKPCPGPGLLAPVMQQQTLGLQGCRINAWPYPKNAQQNPDNPNP